MTWGKPARRNDERKRKRKHKGKTAGGSKGVRLVVTSPEFPEGLIPVGQEEHGHEADRFLNPHDDTELIDSVPAYIEAGTNLSHGEYENEPPNIIQREVTAKSFRDDAEQALNIPSQKIDEIQDAYTSLLAKKGVSLEDIAAQYESVSERGKQYAAKLRERTSDGRSPGDNEELESDGQEAVPLEVRSRIRRPAIRNTENQPNDSFARRGRSSETLDRRDTKNNQKLGQTDLRRTLDGRRDASKNGKNEPLSFGSGLPEGTGNQSLAADDPLYARSTLARAALDKLDTALANEKNFSKVSL